MTSAPAAVAGDRPLWAQRDLQAITALYAALLAGFAIASLLHAPAKGWAVFALAVGFNVALPLIAGAVGRRDWFTLWLFLLPLSLCQVLPDWVLSGLVGTLQFPGLGGPRIDDVIPLAMGGLWVPPLFATVALAGRSAARAAGIALVLFLGSELVAPAFALWKPAGDLREVAGIALYVLPAEAALGWATWTAHDRLGSARWPARLAGALAVSTFYLGALVLAHFLIDVAGWRITA